jgi:hypothetical protein
MVQSAKLVGIFDGHHILNIFDHANERRIPRGIRTDITNVGIRNVVANFTMFYLGAQLEEAVGKNFNFMHLLFEQVQNQSKRRFSSDTRELGEFVHSIFQ